MFIGEIYRYNKSLSPDLPVVDGYPNYLAAVNYDSYPKALLEAGITRIKPVHAVDGLRVPAILISSSPHKTGSQETPWSDFFDPDYGFIKYFGDNKSLDKMPESTRGNKCLLQAFKEQSSTSLEIRRSSTPLIFFRRVAVDGVRKGYVKFQGFGVIQFVELITQVDKDNSPFSNYVFYCAVFSLASENEQFDWEWINARRNPELTLAESNTLAPKSWNSWLKDGPISIERNKRRVSKLSIEKRSAQQLSTDSEFLPILLGIYDYYQNKKTHFELLAARVAEHLLVKTRIDYHFGWITPQSGDHGADFIGRLDIGSGFSKTKIVVLGQAKCEIIDKPTGGNHIARTVARLKRGWIGVYVTTSYFSEPVQQEVIEDQYPIILINGSKLAEEVREMMLEKGISRLVDFLDYIDVEYEENLSAGRPEEIFFL